MEHGGMLIYRRIPQIVRNILKQPRKLQLVQDHLAGKLLLRLYRLIAGLDGKHHIGNFLMQSLLIQASEAILLVKLHTLLFTIVGGNGLHHGIVTGLCLPNAPTVNHRLRVLIDKYFYGIQRTVFHGVGIENRIGRHRRQLFGTEFGEVTIHAEAAFLIFGQGIGEIVNE